MSIDGPGSDGVADAASVAAPAVLAPPEQRAVEQLLSDAWGGSVAIVAAEIVADRSHVVRIVTGSGRTAIVKRPRQATAGRWGLEPLGFSTEWAGLEHLGAMPDAPVPRLLGSDLEHNVMVMEDLAVERTMADSLLGADAGRARSDVVAYAEALGAIHAWSTGRAAEHAAIRRAHGLDDGGHTWWVQVIDRQRQGFLAAAAAVGGTAGLGAVSGIDAEIDAVRHLLDGGSHRGFVHGDPCPDNVVVVDGRCRLVDFERSSPGSPALDVAYLVAPFPSCWCFAQLPDDLVTAALAAHRRVLARAGIDLGDDWDASVAAALAGWIVARGADIARAVAADDDAWGTATMRPRLLSWMGAFLDQDASASGFPRLHSLVSDLCDRLRTTWPDAVVAHYPGLVQPGATRVAVAPADWSPTV